MNDRFLFLEERPGEIETLIGSGGGVLGESSEMLPESFALEIFERLSGFIDLNQLVNVMNSDTTHVRPLLFCMARICAGIEPLLLGEEDCGRGSFVHMSVCKSQQLLVRLMTGVSECSDAASVTGRTVSSTWLSSLSDSRKVDSRKR